MTNEEAIAFLEQYINSEVYTEKCISAHEMAITALRSAHAGEAMGSFPDTTYRENGPAYPGGVAKDGVPNASVGRG